LNRERVETWVAAMKLYPLFLLMATATIFSPGPGVVMTLTNSLRYGLRGTFGGILGISVGALAVAALSATGLGVVLATSAMAFTVMKYAGALYLIYLGVKLWRAPAARLDGSVAPEASFGRRFLEGLSLQLTNPKAIFFFLSVFPQFIDHSSGYFAQFTRLVFSYSALVVVIHSIYALTAHRTKAWLTSERGGRALNKAGGAAFVFFGGALATSQR
jgi:homoserine/homoserine lactone efflux protein